MACRRLWRSCAVFDTPRLLLKASRQSPASIDFAGCRFSGRAGTARSLSSKLGVGSVSRGSFGSLGSLGNGRIFEGLASRRDVLGSSIGIRHVACIGLRKRSVTWSSWAERGDVGLAAQVATDGGVEAARMVGEPRRFAVLTTGHAAEYCVNSYGGYGPMFITILSDPGEIWDEYFVVEGQFPSLEELQKYDGFVVTGSRHDAHGNEEWIEKLCGVLQQINDMRKKSLCVCFGHQVLSRALGGKTGRASVGWEVGLRDISLTDAFFSKSYAAGMPPKLKVLEVHRDQVAEIPPGAELLASSDRTGVEMFAMGEHALAIQGHPEFFDDVVVDLLEGRLAPMMTEEEIKLAKESLCKAKADQSAWQQLCKDFLKGRKDFLKGHKD